MTKLRCPNCGSAGDAELFLSAAADRAAWLRVLGRTAVGLAVLQYVQLHKPLTREMSPARHNKLVIEVLDLIDAGVIVRNSQSYKTPPEAWVWAISEAIKQRDDGKLTLPLSGHGWIYAVLSAYKPAEKPLPELVPATTTKPRPTVLVGSDKPRWEL